MSIFGRGVSEEVLNKSRKRTTLREFEDSEFGYYFQVFLTRPTSNKTNVSSKMWETEKDALSDLPDLVPSLVQRDPKEKDALIIKDSNMLNKFIYVGKIKKPSRMDEPYVKIEDIEKDTLMNYLSKNGIMFKLKIKDGFLSSNRGRVLNIALMDMKDNLKNSEYAKKCVKYTFKDDNYGYERFISKLEDRIIFAEYSAYRGIPNPKNNIDKLDKLFNELRTAIHNTNSDIIGMGFKLSMSDSWENGVIYLETISSIREATVIYEEPGDIKINGQPAEDEEDGDQANYRIEDEPEEDNAAEDNTNDDNNTEETADDATENQETEETTDDNAAEGEEDDQADYRIPDNAEDAPEDDNQNDEGGEEDTQETPDEGEEGDTQETPEEDDNEGGEADYRVDTTGDEETGEDNNADNTGGDDNADNTGGDDNVEETDDNGQEGQDDVKSKENEMLSNLDPEQRRIQDSELKKNYINLYNTIGDIILRLNKISTSSSNKSPMYFIQNQLNDLKEYVYNYLSNVYSTKTYIENNINYEQYLVILSNINNLLIQLNVKSTDTD